LERHNMRGVAVASQEARAGRQWEIRNYSQEDGRTAVQTELFNE